MHYACHSWVSLLPHYVNAMRAAGRSAGTLRTYLHYLSRLRVMYPGNPLQLGPNELNELLGTQGWSPETRKSCRGALRSFYGWAANNDLVTPDPTAKLATVRVPAGVPRPAPEPLVDRVLRECDERTRFMVELAALAGLRAGEVSRVHAGDYVAELGRLYVKGKGGRVRAVPVDDSLLAWRLAQLNERGGWAFPNRWRPDEHLTPGHVTRLMSAAMPAGWTAHTLRHRLATQAYAGSRDLLAVQQLLGHSRPETTQRYVLVPDDATRAAIRAAGRPGSGPRPIGASAS